MGKQGDGGSAFPNRCDFCKDGDADCGAQTPGMSLHDWFTGQALKGIVSGVWSNPNCAQAVVILAEKAGVTPEEHVAKKALAYADAMLAELSKDPA